MSPGKPVSGVSRLQGRPPQATSRLPAQARAGGGVQKVGGGVHKVGGGMQRAGGGTASASELKAAEEEIKRLKDQVSLHLSLSTSLLTQFQK